MCGHETADDETERRDGRRSCEGPIGASQAYESSRDCRQTRAGGGRRSSPRSPHPASTRISHEFCRPPLARVRIIRVQFTSSTP